MTAPPAVGILGGILSSPTPAIASGPLLCAACLTVLAAPIHAATPRLQGIGIDETLAGGAVLAEALNQARIRAHGLPLYARIVLAPGDVDPEGGLGVERLDERVERYRLKGVGVVLSLPGPIPAPHDSDRWRRLLRVLAERYHGRIKAYQIGELGGSPTDARDYAFALKLAAVELRAKDPEAMIIEGSLHSGDGDFQKQLYREDIAPYVDAVAIAGQREDLARSIPEYEALLAQDHGSATIVVTGLPLVEDPTAAARELLEWQLSRLGSKASLTTYAATQAAAAAALPGIERLKELLIGDFIPLEDAGAGLKLSRKGEDVGRTLPHSLLYNLGDSGTYLVYRAREANQGTLEVELTDPVGRKPKLHDALGGHSETVKGAVWDRSAKISRVSVPLDDRPLVLQFAYGETAYVAKTEVRGAVLPPVGEIVFRNQLSRASQEALLQDYMAKARMETHFRLSATTSFDVVTENRFYSDKEGSEWEETEFYLNGTRWGAKRPPLPLPQAEKVRSLPLDLRLGQDYRYRLEGVEKVDQHECFALRFDPMSESQSLYRGTVWIDTKSYATLKIQAVQTHLGAPVVSNEEIQYFTPEATLGEHPLYLLSRFTRRQTMLISGHSILVEHVVTFADFEVNSPGFGERRADSRAGENIMYRDTDVGTLPFVKHGDQRVADARSATTFTALAAGVMVDPSFDFPLPVLGFNYLNLNFLRRGTQATLLFGGLLAVGNVQRPKLFGDKVDASLDLFALAVPVNDRILGVGGEVVAERVRKHPFSTSLNLGYQVTPFQRLVASYRLRFDAYSRASMTAPEFVAPVSSLTNGFGLAYEYQRGGYLFRASGFRYSRGLWRNWGWTQGHSPTYRTYEKAGASLSKDFFINALHKIHLNAAYFGGQRLDRFSLYQFGQFDDNRIHGVPATGVRFADVGMVRGSYSFNLFELYRLDLSVDRALARRRGLGEKWRSITGLGLGLNLRAPFRTLFRGELGKSFLPPPYDRTSSLVAQLIVLKPL